MAEKNIFQTHKFSVRKVLVDRRAKCVKKGSSKIQVSMVLNVQVCLFVVLIFMSKASINESCYFIEYALGCVTVCITDLQSIHLMNEFSKYWLTQFKMELDCSDFITTFLPPFF